jgi:hypothetical protein
MEKGHEADRTITVQRANAGGSSRMRQEKKEARPIGLGVGMVVAERFDAGEWGEVKSAGGPGCAVRVTGRAEPRPAE